MKVHIKWERRRWVSELTNLLLCTLYLNLSKNRSNNSLLVWEILFGENILVSIRRFGRTGCFIGSILCDCREKYSVGWIDDPKKHLYLGRKVSFDCFILSSRKQANYLKIVFVDHCNKDFYSSDIAVVMVVFDYKHRRSDYTLIQNLIQNS